MNVSGHKARNAWTRVRWAGLMVLAAIAGTLAAGVAPALRSRTHPAPSALWLAGMSTRAIEARVSHPGADVYRPYGPLRSGAASALPPAPLAELARLEAEGDAQGLAAAYLVRGNTDLAAAYLEKAGDSPDVASDRALLALEKKDFARALALLDGVLHARPKHAQALWNRGLVLRELELWAVAAQSFDAVAALGESGWADEAKARAEALRGRLRAEREGWRQAMAVGAALVAGTGTVPLEQVQAHPGFMRMYLYEAIRAAPSVERLKALWPLAESLDARFGGTALRDAIRWAEARDFRRRAPLAALYKELSLKHPVPGGLPALQQQLRSAGEWDLLMGSWVTSGALAEHLEEFAALAEQVRDPWFLLLAEQERATVAADHGELLQAEQILLGAVARCQAQPLGYRCGPIQHDLSEVYRQLHRLPEATRAEQAAMAAYREDGSRSETQFLQQLGQLARFRGEASLALASLDEVLLRRPGNCATRHFVRSNDAYALLRDLDVKGARASMGEALSCAGPLSLVGADTLADLARLSPDAEQDRRLLEGLEARRQEGTLKPGQLVLATYIEGHYLIERERARGEELLRRSISEAERLPAYNVDARKARAYSHASLLFAAGRAGEYERALALFGEELGGTLPARCLLAVTVDLERTLVVARGPEGRLLGSFDASRTVPLGEDVRGLIPESMVAPLRACERVDVVARPPLHGRSGLLPEDVAWAYYVIRPPPSPAPPSPPRRLVVANVDAPPALNLPPLGMWEAAGHDAVLLSGADATPGRVLEAMADATEIEVHAHGLVNPSISEASLLVLSPDSGGRYALTAGEVRARRLRGQPLVILGACRAARGAPWMYERFSLPVSFIEAGARTVLAATVDVPDAEAGPFFNAVRARIQEGQDAAMAVRDVRRQWLARDPESWVRAVLVFD